MIKFGIFALTLPMLCLLLAILIDLAVTGQFYSKKDLLCFGKEFDFDDASVFRGVSIIEFTLFIILEIIVFFIGLTLYFLVSKLSCKNISTNFRITIALATTIGVGIILLAILHGTQASSDDTFLVVSSGTMIEQLFLFLLFVLSRKVRNGLRKMFLSKKRSSTSNNQSRKSNEEHHISGVYKELHIPLVAVS